MKRSWLLMVLVAMFATVFVGFSDSASAGTRKAKIRTTENSHEVSLPVVVKDGRKYLERQSFATERRNVRLSTFTSFCFQSARITTCSTSRKIVRTKSGLWAVYTIPGTLDNDLGNWVGDRVVGESWLNLDFVQMSGFPWVRVGNNIRYGRYQEPTIDFVASGIVIRWNANGIFGVVGGPLAPEAVNFVRWNSDHFGWGNNGHTCTPSLDALNHFQCSIPAIYNADCGSLSVVLKDPTRNPFWFDNSAWSFSSNVELERDAGGNLNGRICYVLP